MKLTRSRVGDRGFSNLGSWLQITEIKTKAKEENKGKEGLGRRRRGGERGKKCRHLSGLSIAGFF